MENKLLKPTMQVHAQGLDMHRYDISYRRKERELDIIKILWGDYENILFPILFKQESGKRLDNMLNTGTVSIYLISDRFKNLLIDNAFTGWKSCPVKIIDLQGNVIEGYSGLSITGKCGSIDYGKSEVIEKPFGSSGNMEKYYKGLYVVLDEWDGKDFFLPENNMGIMITERVAKAINANRFTNIAVENLVGIEIPAFVVDRS